jgi:glycosyltransferase involved in cell wall biosynthesis
VFVGAFDYDPNEVAANVVADELAPALPDVEFLLVGRDPPDVGGENVRTPGFVEDLPGVLSLADVAVCPLTMGSGTKLKMLDYLAAGLPIVTTDVGTQGLPLEDGETALVRNSWDEFASAIETVVESEERQASLAANARRLGEEYAWESLMEGYEPVVSELLSED